MSTETFPALWDAPETARFWPDGVGRVILDETDSTMAEARRRAGAIAGPTWIMARRQTAGHGRRGRAWAHPPGNFAATLVMRPGGGAGEAALRSFLAANALFETLAMTAPRGKLAMKWPNDVLLDGGKVAGILLESAGAGRGVDWLSVGIGVNLATAPDAAALEPGATPPVSLAQVTGTRVSPEDFLFWLASHYADQERLFAEFGFAPVRRLWLERAARLGQAITARTGQATVSGIFETVDETGNLVISTAEGLRAIPAADVYFD